MNLTLAIKLFLFTLLISPTVFSQNDEVPTEKTEINSQKEINQKTAIFTLGAYMPKLVDNSNIGNATEGKMSFKLGAQVFVYRNFFAGAFFDVAYLDVTDTDLIGRYNRSTVSTAYLEIGYQLPITQKLNLGVSISPIGSAEYNNVIDADRIDQQSDNAYTTMYKAYLSYNFAGNFSVYIDYAFRNDKTRIETAPEIQANFDKVQYHNIGFGLKFHIDGKTIFE